ncbi:MAG: tetratricopeptide repeat protein [Candidatus Poribacteria bacterium]|nr:tetratricopeptide repeat protein [Candidatus Poribacteria bacterium]
MPHSKFSFFLFIFLLITVVTFIAQLEAEEVSNEQERAITQEFITAAQKFVELGEIDKAIEIYERIVKGTPDDLESRAQLATLYTRTKQYEKAAQTWEKLLETDPENTKYQDGLVYSLRAVGEVDEAFEIAQAYIQTEPEVGAHYARLARLYEAEGKVGEAITNYEKAIELAPGDVQVQTYLKLANHYFLNEDIAAAEKILKNAMLYTRSEFDRRDIELQLIKLYLYQGNLGEVLQKVEAEGIPLSYEISNAKERAQHFLNTGELEKSAAYFKIALVTAKSSYDRGSISNELLKVYLEQDRTDLALELYEAEASEQSRSTLVATTFGPFDINVKFGSDDAREILVNTYKNRGELDVLRTLLEDKLEKNADNPAVIEMLAEIYWNVNDYQKAAEAYHVLSKAESNNIRSFYYAAAAFQKSNQPDMAKELLNRAETALTSVNYRQDGSFLGALATICLKNEMYEPAIKLAGNAIIEAQNFVDPDIEFILNIRKDIIEAQNSVDPDIERVGNAIIETQNSGNTLVVNACLRTICKSRLGLAKYYSQNNIPDKAMEQMQQTGIIHENAWLVLGPFDNTTGIGYDTEYIFENMTQIDLTAKYGGVNKQISWKKFTDAAFDGFIDLGRNINWRVAYAWATVTSPDKREVFFRFGSDDQSKIWLNGTEVFADTNAQTAILDRHAIPVTLKAGKNTILVKVCNEEIDWGFYLRVTDADGKPFKDLKINNMHDKLKSMHE